MNQKEPCQGQKGKLYKWNGIDYEEVIFDESGSKVPVSEEAFEAVKVVREAVQASLGMRPELASAMLLDAAKIPEMVEAVKRYGQSLYSRQ